jgi:hypothetical protein
MRYLKLSTLRKKDVAFRREKAGLKTLVEMRLQISQGPPGDGSVIWLTLDGAAVVEGSYEPGWLFGSEKQRKGENVFLTGVYRKGQGDPQRPTTIQVCDDQSLTWRSCSSGAMLYLA